MAFSEAVKQSVRRKSHFQCCWCKTLGVEIHHIIPQAEGGSNSEDNAAPLCPSCHETFGANPTKRKMITEARDVWYEICATRYAPDADRSQRLIDLLEGLIPSLPEYQAYLSRITKPKSEPHTRAVQQGLTLEASPGNLRLEGHPATLHVADQSVVSILPHETVLGNVIEGNEDESDDEDFRQESRTEIEILEALERLFDQIWYNRHWNFRIAVEEEREKVSPEILKTALEAAARVEEKYKDAPEALGPWDDFEWGMLNGKMSALRWVLGDEWDFLDT